MKPHRTLLCLAALAVGVMIVSAAGGCSVVYTFEISGVIRDVEQGAPLADVEITLVDRNGYELVKGPFVTSQDGRFAFTYDAINTVPDGPWSLKLAKPSYAPEDAEISIDTTALSYKVPTYVHVVAYLRPEEPSGPVVTEPTQ
jgi:hypothetical protein